MRRNSNASATVWTVRVSEADVQKFEATLPFSGAKVWLVDIGLERFLDVVAKASPAQLKAMHDDVQQHNVNEGAPFPYDIISLRIRQDLYNRFNDEFPEKGATSWFVRRTLRNFNEAAGNLMLDDYLQRAISATAFGMAASV